MSSQTIALPAPEKGWILYQEGSEISRSSDLRDLIGHRSDVVIGYPAEKVTTFPVLLPDTEESLHDSMIYSQLEKRGLLTGSEGELLYDYEIVDRGSEGNTFAVSVVSGVSNELIDPYAAGYAPAAALHSVPGNACLLWKEQGRLVLAIYKENEPVHLQVLSGGDRLGATIAGEINLILMGLRGDSCTEDSMPETLVLKVDDSSAEERESFEEALNLRVQVTSASCVSPGRISDRLLPAAVTKARRKRKAKSRNSVILAVLFIAYAVGLSVMIIKSRNTAAEISSLKRQIDIVEPDVARVQQVDQRWRNLEPAFEKSWFPVVQLSRITSALPGSGVVIREYRTSGRNIRLRGQARDVQLANRLLEDLQAMEEFEAYDWSMPNPRVERNNTATFEIEGKPKNAGADS
ncbi:MAG: hypothetical protein VXX36_02240 [Verrucomicrobiota bacterium]|nr:hypothetical protein [Verrucomicrobiota bacterium]